MTSWKDRCTIGITTRDRGVDLKHTIEKQKEIGLGDMNYIIVDDGSSDPDSVRSVAQQLPNCRFIRHETSSGYVQRRQEMAEMCKTEFLISLDDDSYFVDLAGIEEAVQALAENPKVGLVSFRIIQLYVDPRRFEKRTTRFDAGKSMFFRGCGYVVKVKTFLELGGFPSEFRHGGEEAHLQYQFFATGIEILHAPSVVVEHRWTLSGRPSDERVFYLFRSQPMLKLMNEPLMVAVTGCAKLLLWNSWQGVGSFKSQFLGGLSGVRTGLRCRSRCRQLSFSQYLAFRRAQRSMFRAEVVEAGLMTPELQSKFGYCPNV